jgi:hypothetical protein
MALVLLAGGYTLSTLWNDFIPQIFPALPHLDFYQALAVSLVVGLFTVPTGSIDGKSEDSAATVIMNLLAPFLRYGIALLIGLWLKSHLGS